MRLFEIPLLTVCLIVACATGSIPAASGQEAPKTAQGPAPRTDVGKEAQTDHPIPAQAIKLNFQGTPLNQVLDYLGKSAGFVIVREAKVEGTVDVVSHEPLTPDEAVEVLNTVLAGKGLAAIRTERTLKIVTRASAKTKDLPVRYGADPEDITKSDEMITQIVPVRHAEATKLVENLKPLLAEHATIGANESSNAVLITDSQTNIRRYVTIISMLDTSISMITEIRVFPLEYADADKLAEIVNEIFEDPSTSSSQNSGRRGRMAEMFRRMRGGPGGDQESNTQSEARQAANYVKAVGDDQSNCLVVGAPKEVLDTIEKLVEQIDIPKEDAALLRVFPLKYADAETIAESLNDLFENDSSDDDRSTNMFRGPMGGPPMPFGMRGNRTGNQQSGTSGSRVLEEAEVRAVADTRTNSVVVSASEESMSMIEKIITQLDESPKNTNQIYIYRIQHADLETLQELLEGMFEDLDLGSSTGTTTGSQTSRTNQTTPFGRN